MYNELNEIFRDFNEHALLTSVTYNELDGKLFFPVSNKDSRTDPNVMHPKHGLRAVIERVAREDEV